MSPKSPPVSMRLIPEQTDEGVLKRDMNGCSELLSRQPSRCLILHVNGKLSLLDIDDRHEQGLTNSVELFWVTCSQMEEKGNLIREVSWLDYGHQGMQVWYSSHGENPFRQEDFLQAKLQMDDSKEVHLHESAECTGQSWHEEKSGNNSFNPQNFSGKHDEDDTLPSQKVLLLAL